MTPKSNFPHMWQHTLVCGVANSKQENFWRFGEIEPGDWEVWGGGFQWVHLPPSAAIFSRGSLEISCDSGMSQSSPRSWQAYWFVWPHVHLLLNVSQTWLSSERPAGIISVSFTQNNLSSQSFIKFISAIHILSTLHASQISDSVTKSQESLENGWDNK